MIKVKLYELDKHRNETTFRPLLFAHDLFRDVGIEFVSNDNTADFAFVGHASFVNKKISLDDSVLYGLNFLKTVKEPYFLIDGQDAATMIGTYEILEKSTPIKFLKPTLYKDRKLYLEKYINGRIYWGVGQYNIPSLHLFDKIGLAGFNWISTLQPKWYSYDDNKKYDVSAMFTYPCMKDIYEHGINQTIHYNNFRKKLFDNLRKNYNTTMLSNGIRVSADEYYQRMYNSKIILAPFGFGEIAPRDLESAMFGSVLIKPDMSHIETEPNIYIPYETYVPCNHDFSDVEEKIDYILSDFKNLQKFYVENIREKFVKNYNPEKLVTHYYNMFLNTCKVSTI